MKVLLTGATGYIGGAVAKALVRDGHAVSGLARSDAAVAKLERVGLRAIRGDFADPASLVAATQDADAVISTASVGSTGGNGDSFAQDRDAVRTIAEALSGSGKTLMFTSGSAVLGIFGETSATVFDENMIVPLTAPIVAPVEASVNPMIVQLLAAAMAARVETEHLVLAASGIRGIVMRPGLVYGHGGSYDLPGLIEMAKKAGGICPHFGAGGVTQSYVHIDDLADLYALALTKASAGATLHGTTADVRMADLARAISRLLGSDGETASLSLEEMFGAGGPIGISLSLNKKLSSVATQTLLGWNPQRRDILEDVVHGSYADANAPAL
jgi:nucleoside-diphosphate-sugar epimerase